MKCTGCGADNEAGSRFCGSCGAALEATSAPRPGPPGVTCTSCNSINPAGSIFCENCGVRIGAAPALVQTPPAQTAESAPKKTSAAWWLLPILLAWVGGLIAWLVVREDDKAKAKGLLILGIVMTFVWMAVGIAISLLGTVIRPGFF